uniref:MADF domain-containing protein n=1 Tax=Glossina brevipalpis TaxID=37001 RepID=A0A1A9WC85_9MUSC
MSTYRQPVHSVHNKRFWTEFFSLYKSFPALWDMNSSLYKDRQMKFEAYGVMVEKLREIEPNAEREDVLRKINIFRTNFRRECARISRNLQEGKNYKSTLWYFDLLRFLHAQPTSDTRRAKRRKLNESNENSIMRKQSNGTGLTNKSVHDFSVNHKNEYLIEYQPQEDYEEYVCEETIDCEYSTNDTVETLIEEDDHPLKQCQSVGSRRSLSQLKRTDYADELLEESGGGNSRSSLQDYHQEFQNFALARNSQTKQNIKRYSRIDYIPETTQHATNQKQMSDYEYKNACFINPSPPNQLNDSTILQPNKMVRSVKTMTSMSSSLASNLITSNSKLSKSAEILAKSWAMQYDELVDEQKILARKAIADILFEGCMSNLTIGANGRVVIGKSQARNVDLIEMTKAEEDDLIYEPIDEGAQDATQGTVTTKWLTS